MSYFFDPFKAWKWGRYFAYLVVNIFNQTNPKFLQDEYAGDISCMP